MNKDFDLVILGVGMAGVNAANKCASAGWKVAVVDALHVGAGLCAYNFIVHVITPLNRCSRV